jgi:acyl carrier protein
MTKDEIIQKVNEFLVEEIEIEPSEIRPEAELKKDLGIDSLDFVDIVVIVEKKFGFKMKGEDMAEVLTLKSFYDYIERKIAA